MYILPVSRLVRVFSRKKLNDRKAKVSYFDSNSYIVSISKFMISETIYLVSDYICLTSGTKVLSNSA